MIADFFLVVRWWGTLFLIGAAAWPLTKRLFNGWFDNGYFFSKAVGMALVSWVVYALGTIQLMPFSPWSILVSLLILFIIGLLLQLNQESAIRNHDPLFMIRENRHWKQAVLLLLEELFFLIALFFWSWVKGHEPSIRGLEKFMDFGFMQSIFNSQYFPPADMWYAAQPINYYYFGHVVTAMLTKLSGIDLAYSFNLMLATLFALTLTMSFSIGKQICQIGQIRQIGQIGGGFLTAFLVTLAGNMQTIYAFTKGYVGDNVQPFWQLLWPLGEFFQKLPEGMKTYWYANATRFIPFTIHEFPSYSFVVSDVHGHVLSIPFVLLSIALLITISLRGVPTSRRDDAAIPTIQRLLRRQNGLAMITIIFYGFLVGVLLMTNALDGPIYFALFMVLLFVFNSPQPPFKLRGGMGELLLVVMAAITTSLPFLFHFKSFVSGIAVNCPPAFLANTRIGPLIFETVDKCQHSPIWMMVILWGFFIYCGLWIVGKKNKLITIFYFFSVALIIFPEFFYFKDIYPAHFRSNTMFKLGYQAFILFSIVSGYAIISLIKKRLFLIFLLPQLFLISIYPIFSIRSYFGELKKYEGIEGLGWIRREYPDDFLAIKWLKQALSVEQESVKKQNFTLYPIRYTLPTIVEADGDSYTDYGRFSAFTGNSTIVGWAVHEWLWRGGYDVVAPRREEVHKIYEDRDLEETKKLLVKYRVRYVIVGSLERTKFKSLQEWKFAILGKRVFESGETAVWAVGQLGY